MEIDKILGTVKVVAREHLECDQVFHASHLDCQAREKLDLIGSGYDFGFDARRGEEKIQNRTIIIAGSSEPDGRQPSNGFLFDDGRNVVPRYAQTLNQGFRLRIARDRHREISVSSKSWLGPYRHGQASDQSEVDSRLRQVGRDSV